MTTEPVWIVDDDNSIRWVLQKAMQQADIACQSFANPENLLRQLEAGYLPEVVISDVRMPQMDGVQLMQEIHSYDPDIPIIIITAHSDLESAVSAYSSGAFEYLPKPFDVDEAVSLVNRALTHSREQRKSAQPIGQTPTTKIIGEAPAMQEVFRAIGRLSRSSISVLINGQSGTGKELVAQALHQHSPRADKTFIALNTAAIPAELIESELFGHEKGAFTGAQQARKGRFEQADGGTLFLDEIGDMPMNVQTRLLRVLAEGQFYRVGGHNPINVDVRIIAATHQNLEQSVTAGKFREDLFHRLNVIRIHTPSLRERREDIPLLATHFLQQAGEELGVETKVLAEETKHELMNLSWSGNVRQLENTCRWLTVMASGNEILPTDLPKELSQSGSMQEPTENSVSGGWQQILASWADHQFRAGNQDVLQQAVVDFERVLMERALNYTRGHKQQAAKKLGWGRNTLTRKLKELNLE
jgi:two-component system nitrogen regulation response regulator GlnG